jgi:hypothetical protein
MNPHFVPSDALRSEIALVPRSVTLAASGGLQLRALLDLLRNEAEAGDGSQNSMWHSRGALMDAYKEDRLYVQLFDTEVGLERDRFSSESLCRRQLVLDGTQFTLPAFCVLARKTRDCPDRHDVEMIWSAPWIRGMGVARQFIGDLKIHAVTKILPDSRPFWEACDVKILSEDNGKDPVAYRDADEKLRI